jgi:hypothetical protein
MRKDTRQIRDLQTQLFRYRVSRGQYLSDVPFSDLCLEERIAIAEDTRTMIYNTGLELRLVVRKRKWVWRFLDKQAENAL